MKKIIRQIKRRLMVAEIGMSDSVRRPYNKALNWGKSMASIALNRTLPLYEFKDETSETGLSCAYMGPQDHYYKFIANFIYETIPKLQPVNQLSSLNHATELANLDGKYDLIFAQLPYRLARSSANPNGILTVPHISLEINTQNSWEEIQKGFTKSTKKELRRLQGIDFECIPTQDKSDLDRFYKELYRPYIEERFGQIASVTSYDELMMYFNVGWLVQYRFADRLQGAALKYVKGNALYNFVMATPLDATPDERTQTILLNYYYSLNKALTEQYRAVNLGGTRPLLNDGILRYKRKWGAELVYDSDQNWSIWIQVGRNSPQTRRFLAKQLWIWLDQAEELNGFLVWDDDTTQPDSAAVDSKCKSLWLGGLRRIYVYAHAGFAPDVTLSEGPISKLNPVVIWEPTSAN